MIVPLAVLLRQPLPHTELGVMVMKFAELFSSFGVKTSTKFVFDRSAEMVGALPWMGV